MMLPSVATSVREARQAVRGSCPPGDLQQPATLLVSELVGNAIRHGAPRGTQVRFRVRCDEGNIRVEVTDDGPGFDPEIRHDTAGYGLRLLDQLASHWGADRSPEGFCVWFELDVDHQPVPRPASARQRRAPAMH